MKTYTALFIILTLLGTGLYLSDRYERDFYEKEIAITRCERAKTFTFAKIIEETGETGEAKTISMNKGILNLGNQELIGLREDAFVNYFCIHIINLSQNRFTTIPKALKSLADLESLDLSENFIANANFPTTEHEHNLKILNLSKNRLTTLDTTLFYLANLDELNLSFNSISNIDNLVFLKDGSSLLETENQLKKSSLTSLDLAFNELELFYLPKNNFERLKVLNLMGNNLTRVGFDGGKVLQKIDLSHNYLKSIIFNKTPDFYQNLEEIDLSYNVYLTDFPLEALMKAAPNLKIIYLEGTGIAKNPELKLKFQTLARQKGVKLIFSK